jgi:glycosyltransferase involved in cell wall biosynthesis
MRIVLVNVVWDEGAATAEATLDRFTTLTGWAEAVAGQDPTNVVAVCQRFRADADRSRSNIAYRFVADDGLPKPSAWFRGTRRLIRAVASPPPDVVHVNGLDHPLFVRRLRRALPARCALVVQDHGGFDPRTLSAPRKAWLRHGLRSADALLVATPRQIEVFAASGLTPRRLPICDVMEASTSMRADPTRDRHRPLSLLWVGRLDANKDPLTVLEGVARFVERSGVDATLTFVYGSAELEPALRAAIEQGARMTTLRPRVRLAGLVPHDALGVFYDAADILVLGSHREGSGYAVLEALACGVVPIVTDIPSLRSLTGEERVGALWRVDDPASLADALERVSARPMAAERAACRAWFDDRFSWNAIGRRALAIYREVSRT